MKFLKALFGKDQQEKPVWNIKAPVDRPAPKPRSGAPDNEAASAASNHEPNPFLDDIALDTMSLEAEAIPDDNPYATYTWEQDLDNDTRKMRTIQIGEKTDKKPGSEFNPYDTGKMRRGWKK